MRVIAGALLSPSKPANVLATVAALARLSRPLFLGGGILGALLGTAIAAFEGHRVSWERFALAQAAITALQLMTHYANDFFDRHGDRDTGRTLFSGGSGVLAARPFDARLALAAALAALAAGLLATLTLLACGLTAAGLFAAAIAFGAWTYSAPPARLVARGLGELDATLVVGVLVPLCAYAAQAGRPTPLALAATVPTAAAMFVLMLAVELPDADGDAAAGKRTLVVRWEADGWRTRFALGLAFSGVAGGALLARSLGAPAPIGLAFAALLLPAIPLGVAVARRAYRRSPGSALVAGLGVAAFACVTLASALVFACGARGAL